MSHEPKENMKPHTPDVCPRDQDVDDWFDERFESMKEDADKEAVPDSPIDADEVDEDDPLADMMDMEGML